ncbi:hypothetical protein CRUP_038811 [Coryphaenoides rupestris]|nr:hypothetical protein CRUP_038811 [Coryphaenoides rupestris]
MKKIPDIRGGGGARCRTAAAATPFTPLTFLVDDTTRRMLRVSVLLPEPGSHSSGDLPPDQSPVRTEAGQADSRAAPTEATAGDLRQVTRLLRVAEAASFAASADRASRTINSRFAGWGGVGGGGGGRAGGRGHCGSTRRVVTAVGLRAVSDHLQTPRLRFPAPLILSERETVRSAAPTSPMLRFHQASLFCTAAFFSRPKNTSVGTTGTPRYARRHHNQLVGKRLGLSALLKDTFTTALIP